MTRTGLLVSVRSADEALEALAGGADVIDVKEPDRGALGRADNEIISEVIATVAGRAQISVAQGELTECKPRRIPEGVRYVKWGLGNLTTQVELVVSALRATPGPAQPVLVAYADHRRAGSPDPAYLANLACQLRFPAFLLDTSVKDGSTLLDWIPAPTLARIGSDLADARVRVALAGSLGKRHIKSLASIAPNWFAVRGAVCDGGRAGRVNAKRVRELKQLIAAAYQ
jgi:(5-formylfuran-3-yl)methyl phosphate synthase